MDTKEISLHLLKVFEAAKFHGGWLTSKQLAETASVAGRTARKHAKDLVAAGIFDVAEVFPENRYRVSTKAVQNNLAMLQRLDQARMVFGL